MKGQSVYIPQPETTLDLAASIYGFILMAEKCDKLSDTKRYLDNAKERSGQLLKMIEEEK